MCGIMGWVDLKWLFLNEIVIIIKMVDILLKRGFDDINVWI